MERENEALRRRIRRLEARETVRRRAEEAVKLSEERLRLVQEVSGMGVYDHLVPVEEACFLGERWADILGYTLAELPSRYRIHDWWRERIHPEDRERVDDAYEDFVEGVVESYDIVFRVRHRSGDWRHVHNLSRAVEREDAGRAVRVVGLLEDITEEYEADAEREALIRI